MGSTLLRWADRRTEPWANGSGLTHPLVQGPGPEGWRVSIAEIAASSPFSRLPDLDRQLVCLGPAPIVLYVDGRPRDVAVGELTAFSGGSEVRCEVDEPTLALNVMSRVASPAPSLQLVELRTGVSRSLPEAGRGVLVVLTGLVRVTTPDVSARLARLDALDWSDAAAQLEGTGRVAVIGRDRPARD